jgi:peptidoglycan/xylan/chitin deacetylase (PgdA/CDA1 family)/PKD repeat protein
VYSGPFTLNTSATVRFFSTDLAQNSEQPQAQQLEVAPYKTAVALTFDDQYATVYQYLRPMLRARGMNITIYTITSDSTGPFPCCMSYAQLRTMQAEGDDIGGHGRNHLDLTDPSTTTAEKSEDVCGGRQDLLENGISDPSSYAYPFGKVNASAEAIVKSCGFDTARQGGGLASVTTTPGPRYAETMPPADPYAMRAIDVDAPNAKSLADMKAFVSAAASHGGGLLPITFHQVCDQAMPDYASCMSSWGAVDTDVLRQFLDWLADAGTDGGAPAGVEVQTVREAVNSPDSAAPSTVAQCNGLPCSDTPYGGSLRVSLSASDPGGVGVRKTFYTTDGSTPTASSSVYSEPVLLLSSTTVKFYSIDNAGNAEDVRSVDVQVRPNPEPVIAAAGDIACDPTTPAFRGGNGTVTDCRAKGTSNLLVGADAVLPLGDDQYNCGGYDAFMQSYEPAWGRYKTLTHPVPGDKEYATSGGTDCSATPGAGYFRYFGGLAGDPDKGYYSYDIGSWHVVALNTGPCESTPSACAAGSPQDQWLKQDLAANASSSCTLAYYQTPRFESTNSGGNTSSQAFWSDLYDGGADVVLNGDAHWYERFTPMDAAGNPDASHGVQQFIVGTGGAGLSTPAAQLPTSLALDSSTHGVIQLVLHDGSYSWTFLHDMDGVYTDSGSAGCHSAPVEQTPPATTLTCNGTPCLGGWYNNGVQVTLTATDNTGGSGVDKTYYTTDGSTPTKSSAVATGPFTVSSTSTLKYFSVDKVGNAETVQSQQIRIDRTPATTTIRCNTTACSTGWYTVAVQVTLPATDDTGGSGVAATYYTTDGSTPTAQSAKYAGAFTVASTTTVKFFSLDTAGNTEGAREQLISLDGTAPVTTIQCNGGNCPTTTYPMGAVVSVTLSATDNRGGSGIGSTHYTTDGSVPTLSSPTYSSAFTVSKTTSVRYRSWDIAGNLEPVRAQAVQIAVDQPPVAKLSVTPSSGTAPLTVTASAAGSSDTDPTPIASYAFDFGDGTVVSNTAPTATHAYTAVGTFTVTVTVRDTAALAGTATQKVTIKKK